MECDAGPRRRDVLLKGHIFAGLSLAEWGSLSSDLGGVIIFTPGDLKSAPPSEFHVVSGPDVQSEMLRGPARTVSVLISRLTFAHFLALATLLMRPRCPQRPNGIPPMSRILVRVTDARLRPHHRRDSADVEPGQCSGLAWAPVEENGVAHRCSRGFCRDPRVHSLGQQAQPFSASRSELAAR